MFVSQSFILLYYWQTLFLYLWFLVMVTLTYLLCRPREPENTKAQLTINEIIQQYPKPSSLWTSWIQTWTAGWYSDYFNVLPVFLYWSSPTDAIQKHQLFLIFQTTNVRIIILQMISSSSRFSKRVLVKIFPLREHFSPPDLIHTVEHLNILGILVFNDSRLTNISSYLTLLLRSQ